MRFELEIGPDRCRVEFARDFMTGHATITIDGDPITVKSALNPFTHFSFQLVNRYQFVVGMRQTHEVTIEHERPLLLAGFRPHTYRVFVDGKLIDTHHGY